MVQEEGPVTVQGGGGGRAKGRGSRYRENTRKEAHQGLGRRGGGAFKVGFLGSLDFFFFCFIL